MFMDRKLVLLLFVSMCRGDDLCSNSKIKFQSTFPARNEFSEDGIDVHCFSGLELCTEEALEEKYGSKMTVDDIDAPVADSVDLTPYCAYNKPGIKVDWRLPSHGGAMSVTGFIVRLEMPSDLYRCVVVLLKDEVNRTNVNSRFSGSFLDLNHNDEYRVTIRSLPSHNGTHTLVRETHTTDCGVDVCRDSGGFLCSSSGKCIAQHFVCDGRNECGDHREDEENCTLERCRDLGRYICNDTAYKKCIDKDFVCDGYKQCPSWGEDERDCSPEVCRDSGRFFCKVGWCINQDGVCDGYYECPHGDDEENCTVEVCRDLGRVFCNVSGVCIDQDGICDGNKDCRHGEDEENCTLDVCRDLGRFFCNISGVCIDQGRVCDGGTECPHGEDEQNCRKKKTHKPKGQSDAESGSFRPNYHFGLVLFGAVTILAWSFLA